MKRLSVSILNNFRAYANFRLGWRFDRPYYELLSRIPQMFPVGSALSRRLLIDGHFFNPGYFYRVQLFRAAMGSGSGDELGFFWRHNSQHCAQILRTLGVRKTHRYFPRTDPRLRSIATQLAQKIRSGDDLLELEFPHKIPASFLYDDILKRQRSATVNALDPNIERHIWEFLSSIRAAEDILDCHEPDCVAMSHSILTQCSPLAWLAATRGIPVVTLFGNYGLPRFWRMRDAEDIHYGMDRPEKNDLDRLATNQADALAEIGSKYLAARLSGHTDDLGGRMAFKGDSDKLRLKCSNVNRPTVAVYASNWFDFPHALGMSRFRDFYDWIESTLQVAIATPSVRWLFRAHPCDKWYGGITLKDMLPQKLPDHIVLLPDECSGQSVMKIADALVTYHGTAAIEYAAMGKPVLVADKGWFHDCGFVLYPESRDEYLRLLGEDWFNRPDLFVAKRQAELFAGLYFCCPRWQSSATLPDDSDRDALVKQVPQLLNEKADVVGREVDTINKWFESGCRGYHTYKMTNESCFALSNVTN